MFRSEVCKSDVIAIEDFCILILYTQNSVSVICSYCSYSYVSLIFTDLFIESYAIYL